MHTCIFLVRISIIYGADDIVGVSAVTELSVLACVAMSSRLYMRAFFWAHKKIKFAHKKKTRDRWAVSVCASVG